MNISLENFRAQIGNLNEGQVIIKDDQLQKVNNGFFARHFDCFKTTTTREQNQQAIRSFYSAVKQSVADSGRSEADQNYFLMKIREELGIRESYGQTSYANKPLDRRTIKLVVENCDSFRDDWGVLDSFRTDFECGLKDCALKCGLRTDDADEAANFFKTHQLVKTVKETFVTSAIWSVVDCSAEELAELKEEVGGDTDALGKKLMEMNKIFRSVDTQDLVELNRHFGTGVNLAKTYDKFNALDEKTFANLTSAVDMANAVRDKLDGSGYKVVSSMEKAVECFESFKTDSMLRKKFIQYLNEQLSSKMQRLLKDERFHAEISSADMERVIARLQERVVVRASFSDAFWGASPMAQTEYLAKLCVKEMDETALDALFGTNLSHR